MFLVEINNKTVFEAVDDSHGDHVLKQIGQFFQDGSDLVYEVYAYLFFALISCNILYFSPQPMERHLLWSGVLTFMARNGV